MPTVTLVGGFGKRLAIDASCSAFFWPRLAPARVAGTPGTIAWTRSLIAFGSASAASGTLRRISSIRIGIGVPSERIAPDWRSR